MPNLLVLILVLVEDGLGVRSITPQEHVEKRLNPCFSGGWSRREGLQNRLVRVKSVLILVLVEDGLGGGRKDAHQAPREVLILVLVEDGLGELGFLRNTPSIYCLNPCFSGGWSRSMQNWEVRLFNGCLNPCFSGGWSRRRVLHTVENNESRRNLS